MCNDELLHSGQIHYTTHRSVSLYHSHVLEQNLSLPVDAVFNLVGELLAFLSGGAWPEVAGKSLNTQASFYVHAVAVVVTLVSLGLGHHALPPSCSYLATTTKHETVKRVAKHHIFH